MFCGTCCSQSSFSFPARPDLMEDDEPVCPIPAITEKVKHHCAPEWKQYEGCTNRIKSNPEADCEAWYFDYYKCLDKWRGPEIFKKLK